MIIDGRRIGGEAPCYLVAEVGASHGGSYARAQELIRIAATVGAAAVKLQCYAADDMTLDRDGPGFVVPPGSPWAGRRLYDLYREAGTPPAWMPGLFATAREVGIACFATPFHPRHVPILEDLGAPAYKIASFELGWPDLLRAVARTRKPVLLSTGLSRWREVAAALDVLAEEGCGADRLAVLRCASAYPAPLDAVNLRALRTLRAALDARGLVSACVGLSDHTRVALAPVLAVALGAAIVERHLRLDDDDSPDATFASDPETWRHMAISVWRAEVALGGGALVPPPPPATGSGARGLRSSPSM